mmetsp:Transcript_166062/g.533029  ORF Transcript_166062/g.533029 Transcript_166062/m.533029 type:complete len:337 (+) Transcript_166062:121-1131(+)
MLRSWHVALDSDDWSLTKTLSKDGWDAGAVLQVGDPASFEVTINFEEESLPLIFGITKADAISSMKEKPRKDEDLPKMFVRANTSQCFVFVDDDQTTHSLNYDTRFPEVLMRIKPFGRIENTLTVRFENGCVSFLSGQKVWGPHEVRDKDYRPCVFLHEKNTSVKLSMNRKRVRSQESLGSRLWKSRRFTDAKLKCIDREVLVHREILVAASPVFDRMWSGSYREAGESTVEITDVPTSTVEAMVQYMYTDEVPAEGDPVQLYGVAKKYELDNLAEEVGARLVENIDAENVQDRARILRLHATAGDAQAKKLWEQMYKKLQENPPLMQVLLESLLP